jgi:hypothetical protein
VPCVPPPQPPPQRPLCHPSLMLHGVDRGTGDCTRGASETHPDILLAPKHDTASQPRQGCRE